MSSVSKPQISPTHPPTDRSLHALQSIPATGRYGINDFSKDRIHTALAANIAPYILGPMPPDAFLDRFLPSQSISIPEGTPSFQAGMFTSLVSPTNASGVTGAAGTADATGAFGATKLTPYKAMKDSLQTYLPALDICTTAWSDEQAENSRFPFKMRPDCSVYAKEISPECTNSSLLEFFIEHKSQSSMDPFIIPNSKSCVLGIDSFVKDSTEGISALGQMASYVTSHMSSQFRTHVFFVLIVQDYARIIRWDRGGAVVTAPIYFNEECHLFDFFIHYNYAKPGIRGSDTSVRAPETKELHAATHLINEFCESGSDKGKAKNFLVVSVPRCGSVNESDHYVIEAPFATISPPTGRATRTFIAYDIRRDRRVFVKDSWRIDMFGVPKEGDSYETLQAKEVPHIAHCSSSGDIGDDTYHRTQTHTFVNADWAVSPNPAADFTPHRHYRIVLDTIGTPLKRFKCSRDMVRAIRASLAAHQAAYRRCGILHRDISPSNILISEGIDDGGLLIDWDLCKNVNSTEQKARRRASRTGTWQFMAADLIADPEISQTFIHDLESAFYVMFWLSLKYLPNSYSPSQRGLVLSKVFNPTPADSSLSRMSPSTNPGPLHSCGDSSKATWMAISQDVKRFKVTGNAPLTSLLSSLKTFLAPRHFTADLIEQVGSQFGLNLLDQFGLADFTEKFQNVEYSYSQVIDRLDDALQKEWPDDDSAQLQKIYLPGAWQAQFNETSVGSRMSRE